MHSIGFINTDNSLREEITGSICDSYTVVELSDKGRAEYFLNYELSEILIINFSDKDRDFIDYIANKIYEDSWLHSFGVIGIVSGEEEDEILKRYSHLNIMVLMNPSRLKTHLCKSLDIINRERQIIFQKVVFDDLIDNANGTFLIENDIFVASIYASIITTALSQRGVISLEKKMMLQIVLSELIINGIEHGNCGITYEDKTAVLIEGKNIVDLITEKNRDPEINKKRVYVEWAVNSTETTFTIRDEGEGFDPRKLKDKLKEDGPESLHGRGIKMAVQMAREIRYNTRGNSLKLILDNDPGSVKNSPGAFAHEDPITVNKGDIIFKEGSADDFLYYIVSGTYNVYVADVLVGRITPSDVFMGEMSFLLQNKRSATVIANGDGKVIKISRNSYITAIKSNPHYAILLSKLLAKKLNRANESKVKGETGE